LASEVLAPVRSSQFKRDVKRMEKRSKDMNKLRALLLLLIEEGRCRSTTAIIR
jgi:mRNA interferase YafQ